VTDHVRLDEEFDLQPDPRVLPMLGEINLTQWRCLAEFVDNSVDGFLEASLAGQLVESPEIHVTVPTANEPTAKVSVRDNGPGMDPETLERAVRAGWTGNDPISRLGMFGMGFNIATARLGTVTRVWTTRAEDGEWHGLEINFERLMRQRNFRTPRLTRAKVDPREHGTEVSIDQLKPEQRIWFSRPANRTRLSKELGRTYSAMLRPGGRPVSFRLTLNGNQARRRDHCVWGGEGNPDRQVETARYGTISAYQPVDVRLADRPFCTRDWQWLPAGETDCPSCGLNDAVVSRVRRVHGWLGLQRYLSNNDYGIDFLRNGRKIESANRDLFVWNDGDVAETEYPIDDPRNRGRIVGEIHLDHCRVMYTKDRFDRNDPAWEEMVRIVRGEGPLRPDKASQLGVGENTSPLFRLFQAFRRSSPKPKIAGSYAKLLIVPDNDMASEMAKRFYAGEPEYQADLKWWDLVQEADRSLLVPDQPEGPGESDGLDDFGTPTDDQDHEQGAPQEPEAAPEPPPPERVVMPSLSRVYRDDGTGQRWDVRGYRVEASDPELNGTGAPWALKASPAGFHEFLVNPEHDVFRSATMTPLDGLLAELAWSAMDFQRGNPSSATFASVLAYLRDQYAGTSKLDIYALSGEATLTLRAIAENVSRNVEPEDGRALFEELSPTEQDGILQRMASRDTPNPHQVIDEGRFLEFAPGGTLLRVFEAHPELFLDGNYWDVEYATLDYGRPAVTEEARGRIVRHHANLLGDAVWLAEQDATDLERASRERLLRAALALELLDDTASSENE
jgi:hypothetical protein